LLLPWARSPVEAPWPLPPLAPGDGDRLCAAAGAPGAVAGEASRVPGATRAPWRSWKVAAEPVCRASDSAERVRLSRVRLTGNRGCPEPRLASVAQVTRPRNAPWPVARTTGTQAVRPGLALTARRTRPSAQEFDGSAAHRGARGSDSGSPAVPPADHVSCGSSNRRTTYAGARLIEERAEQTPAPRLPRWPIRSRADRRIGGA
jgi:hypothetical protein